MSKNGLLHDRNILFTNNSGHFAASLASQLCEMGANVMIADKETKGLSSFQSNLLEQREIYPNFGRLALCDFDKKNADDRKMVFQKSAESFGGINAWIDLSNFFSSTKLQSDDFDKAADSFINEELLPQLSLYKTAVDYLKDKRNSCILRMVPEDLGGATTAPLYHLLQSGLQSMQNSLNYDKELSIRFLNIEVGPTEDYLLKRFTGKKLNEALKEYQVLYPQAELVDTIELSTTMAFLMGNKRNSLRISNVSLSCS